MNSINCLTVREDVLSVKFLSIIQTTFGMIMLKCEMHVYQSVDALVVIL